MLDRAEATQVFQLVDIDMPVVDLVAALPQEIADHVLARTFGAANRGNRDKIPRRRKLRSEIGVDGVQDLLSVFDGVHFVPFSDVAFRIAAAPVQSRASVCAPWRHGWPAIAIFSIS